MLSSEWGQIAWEDPAEDMLCSDSRKSIGRILLLLFENGGQFWETKELANILNSWAKIANRFGKEKSWYIQGKASVAL